MKKITAEAEVIGGKLKLKNSAKFIADVGALKGEVLVTVSKKERVRSLPQNNYYWGVVIKMIADFVGESEAELIHEAMGVRFAGIPAGDGTVGRALLVRKSTTEMTTFEFEEYIEKIRNFAAMELQLRIPLPNEVLDL